MKTHTKSKQTSKNTNKHTARYRKNEALIRNAIFMLLPDHRGNLTAGQIARYANLSRLTVYNHHKNISRAIIEIEDELLEEFTAALDSPGIPVSTIKDANRRYFFALFTFMHRHREVFCPVCMERQHVGLLLHMMRLLYPRLEVHWLPKGTPAPAIGSERADFFMWMLVGIISRWGMETKCSVKESGYYMGRIMRVIAAVSTRRIV